MWILIWKKGYCAPREESMAFPLVLNIVPEPRVRVARMRWYTIPFLRGAYTTFYHPRIKSLVLLFIILKKKLILSSMLLAWKVRTSDQGLKKKKFNNIFNNIFRLRMWYYKIWIKKQIKKIPSFLHLLPFSFFFQLRFYRKKH